MSPEQYIKLKDNVNSLQRDFDRSEGAKSQLKTRLKNEFECLSIKDAKKIHKQNQLELEKLEEEFKEALEEFKNVYSEQIQE